MVRYFLLSIFLVSLLKSYAAKADCSDVGILILRSSAVKEKVYGPFLDNECVRQANLVFGNVDYNPLTANQVRDLEKMNFLTKALGEQSPRGIIILAYSETGKFAAKLASLHSHVKSLFLMDPVDGTPPFSSPKRFPVFLDANFPTLTIPTIVLESEFGPKFKRLGLSCVPEDMGPERFYRHVDPVALQRVYMDGLGHADFLKRTGVNLVELMCGGGQVPKDEAFSRVLQIWNGFLEQVPAMM
jgi:hypothetical protein